MNALLLAALLAAQPSDAPTAPLAPEPPAPLAASTDPSVRKMTMDDCVREALKESGTLLEARGKVKEWEGKLLEVQSSYWPKLQGLTYVAPLYGLKLDPVSSLYQSDLTAWGPYVKFQAILAQPIYTFGRVEAGEKAAQNRMDVEKARYEQARNLVALEVRRYYLLHLYARSMQPALRQAKSILDEAETSAKELNEEGSGSVTQVDLAKLRYGGTELAKYQVQATMGAALALGALKHTMGMPESAAIELADEALPPLPTTPLPPLADFVTKAALKRPEVSQLKYGAEAARWFAESEKLSWVPIVAVAGQLDVNWAQLSTSGKELWPINQRVVDGKGYYDPYAWDRFNSVTPGIALALQFDIDPRKAWARYEGAKGLMEQVEGLKKFASTGIPMEVRKTYDDAVQADQLTKLSNDGSNAGKKWLVFAGTAYAAGTGEAKDLLEGLVVYLTARQSYFSNLQAAHFARANLLYVTGETGVD